MPTVTINDRAVEVEAGTNLIDAALEVGVQIPHYCYHPRLSVVGQCRMCLVHLEGVGKLQAACATQVTRDGMVVRTDTEEVAEAQRGMMEFLLVNHPLDCPICDQAGECGLQDYSFKHGQAFSRFRYEDKRTYPEKERIPLGPHVLLNMNRCIQCTRCIRFCDEVSETGELGFFNRGARTEIGVFPGKPLDNELSGNVVDVCPVGALTSTRFRFAERVWYLDKKPSLCSGCDAGCNITVEHRRGSIKRYKPRFNPEVNDYWLCDHGRGSWQDYENRERLTLPRALREGNAATVSWKEALDLLARRLRIRDPQGTTALLGSGTMTTEEAFLLAALADATNTPHRSVARAEGPTRRIPNPQGGVEGRELEPNRRGAELAGLAGDGVSSVDAKAILEGDGASDCSVLVISDSNLAGAGWDEATVARLRKAGFLAVFGWADSPLAQAADLALPIAHHVENDGSFVNSQHRLQRFERAFPPPGQARSLFEVLSDLLGRFATEWQSVTREGVRTRLVADGGALEGVDLEAIPPTGTVVVSTQEVDG